MRKKTAGLVLAAAGAVLILSALLLLFHNRQEDRQAGERSQAVLEELWRVATDDATLPVGSLAATEGPEATQVPEMPTAQIDGYDYIGTHICQSNRLGYYLIKRTADTSQMAAEIKTLFIRNHIYLHTDSEKDVQVLRKRFLEWKNRNACKLNGKY